MFICKLSFAYAHFLNKLTQKVLHIQTRFWLWDFLVFYSDLDLSHIQTKSWLWDFLDAAINYNLTDKLTTPMKVQNIQVNLIDFTTEKST